jgi:ammonia channel protein AmtB
MQVLNQLAGVIIVFVYDAIVSLIILKIVDVFVGLRISEDVERRVSISRCTARPCIENHLRIIKGRRPSRTST